MTVAFPWSGRDVNALVPLSGRAAVPNTPAGAGFNWPSLVSRVSGYIRPVRGWGMSGLGQFLDTTTGTTMSDTTGYTAADIQEGGTYFPPSGPNPTQIFFPSGGSANSLAAGGVSNASSQAPWWGNILAGALSTGLKTGSQIASYQLNPLYQKSTFYQTPQGAIYASNVPTGGIPGLTTGTGSSLLPILLIGGVLVMFMSMRK